MPPSPASPPDPQSNSPWNPVVISFVGAICTIFLILSYYKILGRCCFDLQGILLGDRTRRRLLNETNPDDPSLQFQSRGLDSTILATLPSIQFRKKIDDVEASGEGTDCSVCLSEFEEGDWLRLLPNCAHVFHISCIDAWFRTHSNCPLCRSHVFYDFTSFNGYSMVTLFETLRREDVHRERSINSQNFGTHISQNRGIWSEETNSGSSHTDSQSSITRLRDRQNVGCLQEDHLRLSSQSSITRLRDQQNVGCLQEDHLRRSSSSTDRGCENQSTQISDSSTVIADSNSHSQDSQV